MLRIGTPHLYLPGLAPRSGQIRATRAEKLAYKPGMKLWVVACLAACAAPGQKRSSIRVDVGLVNVGFSVRDSSGKLVTNLTESDFEIAEDGVPQKISFFGRSTDMPLNLGLIMDVSGSQQSFIRPHMHDLQEFLKMVLR